MVTTSNFSVISKDAKLGKNVKIGDFCKIYGNVEIGDNSVIEDYSTLGYPTPLAEGRPLVIGSGAHIRSYSCFYEGSEIGPNLRTGHRVTVRERAIIGRDFQIGTLSDLQGHCEIGDFVRTHSNVHIGQRSTIKNFVWIFPYTVLTNDPHPPSDSSMMKGVFIDEYAVIATSVTILPGIHVAKNSLIGAHSLVNRDVPEGKVVAGVPAKVICDTSRIKLTDGSNRSAYPWTQHFHRGYPAEAVEQWKKEI